MSISEDPGGKMNLGMVCIPVYEGVLQDLGASGKPYIERNAGTLWVPSLLLEGCGLEQGEVACLHMPGDSMSPLINHCDLVIIDIRPGAMHVFDGKTYALDHNGHLRVCSIIRMPETNGIRLIPINRDSQFCESIYTQTQIEQQNLKIIGRVACVERFH